MQDESGDPVEEDSAGPIRSIEGRAAPAEWLFLVGNRMVIAAVLLVSTFGILALSDVAWGAGNGDRAMPLFYLFGGLVGGNFTLITIVLSITQLVVSRQLGTPGEIRDHIESTNAYRDDVKESVDVDVAPATPTGFLDVLLRSSADSIETVRGNVDSVTDGEARTELLATVDDIQPRVEYVRSLLDRSDVDVFHALSAALRTNYSEEMHRLQELQAEHGDAYPRSVLAGLDDLDARLRQIDVARQYLKTLYIQNELSRLSRYLLYVGVPAILVSILLLKMFSAPPTAASESSALVDPVTLGITVAMAPLSVLFSFVLRLSTVAQRTAAITPFTTAAQDLV